MTQAVLTTITGQFLAIAELHAYYLESCEFLSGFIRKLTVWIQFKVIAIGFNCMRLSWPEKTLLDLLALLSMVWACARYAPSGSAPR